MGEDRQAIGLKRPRPPQSLFSIDSAMDGIQFIAAPELSEWLMATFIADDGPLHNPDHAHLQMAQIGCLWTTVENGRHGRVVIGQAEFGPQIGGMGKWQKSRAQQHILELIGFWPDFLLTFYAPYADSCSDPQFCALTEHELYHCGQERDIFGVPRFKKTTGAPAFCLRGHDVEEFVGVVRRYGSDAAGVRDLVEAAAEGPTIADADISVCCGSCQ